MSKPNYISKESETYIWNEIQQSSLKFQQKCNLLRRLRIDNLPKNPIQQTLDRWVKYQKNLNTN